MGELNIDDSALYPHPRDDVKVGGFYSIGDSVYRRSSSEICPDHPQSAPDSVAMCCDLLICDVFDLVPETDGMATRIAHALNREATP